MRVRATRNNQTLDFPIVLSNHYDEWRLVAAAYVVPPLLFFTISRSV